MTGLINIASKYKILLLNGLEITLIVSFATIFLGLILGTLMSFAKMSKIKILKALASIYVEFIRGTPVLVQIFIVFYGLPMMGISIPTVRIGDVDISRLISGILALTINTTAYVCEIVRGGIQSVELGQTEGAKALGMNPIKTMYYIILPQAFKNILPSLGNEFITIIKTSSQISVIGIADLMYTADTIRGISFKPMAPLILVALIYFVVTYCFSLILKRVEKRLARSNR